VKCNCAKPAYAGIGVKKKGRKIKDTITDMGAA
jgi:hypothetical protein